MMDNNYSVNFIFRSNSKTLTGDQEQGFKLNSSPNKNTQSDTSSQGGCNDCINLDMENHPSYYTPNQGFIRGIPSVAWMIIVGDGFHNLADGIAIGMSFTVSIGLGFSISLAILFHEVPHEFGE